MGGCHPGARRRNKAENDDLTRAVCTAGRGEAGRVVGMLDARGSGVPTATSVRGVLWRRGHSCQRGPWVVAWIAPALSRKLPRLPESSKPSPAGFWILIVVEGSRHVKTQSGNINKETHSNEEPHGLIM